MVRATATQNIVDTAMAPYKAVLKDMKKRWTQLPITMFLKQNDSPGPSTV